MNTERLAARVGADWSEIAAMLAAAGLDASEIETVRTVPARINNRITRCLGRVKLERGTRRPVMIELSGQLLAMGQAREISDVLLHEIAHLAAGFRLISMGRSESAHGPVWSRFARALGVPARATMKLSYDAPRPGLKTVAVCSACSFELQKTRRLNSRRTYRHRGCGGTFIAR